LGDQLQSEFGAEVELIAGSGGVYIVAVDGQEIYSKAKSGRFPEPEEIIAIVKRL